MDLTSTEMTTKFSFLYGIAIKNWFPTLHMGSVRKFMGKVLYSIGLKGRVDIDQIIFDQIAAHGVSSKVNHPIGFHSLIYELVIGQHPGLKAADGALSREPLRFNADLKLFTRKHTNDIETVVVASDVQEDVQSPSYSLCTSSAVYAATR